MSMAATHKNISSHFFHRLLLSLSQKNWNLWLGTRLYITMYGWQQQICMVIAPSYSCFSACRLDPCPSINYYCWGTYQLMVLPSPLAIASPCTFFHHHYFPPLVNLTNSIFYDEQFLLIRAELAFNYRYVDCIIEHSITYEYNNLYTPLSSIAPLCSVISICKV